VGEVPDLGGQGSVDADFAERNHRDYCRAKSDQFSDGTRMAHRALSIPQGVLKS
jgi:hypothetical protein